jgi:hypothetical protein
MKSRKREKRREEGGRESKAEGGRWNNSSIGCLTGKKREKEEDREYSIG